MRIMHCLAIAVCALASVVHAQQVPASAPAQQAPTTQQPAASVAPSTIPAQAEPVREFETVTVVGGLQPGPRLWRVKNGDHTLYILGTVSPLPNTISWDSAHVESVLARSQEVIHAPYLAITAKVGIFRGLMLAPAYFRAKKNPDGKMLKDVLPAPLYARWAAARSRYLPNADLEDKRPIVAAQELYSAALKSSKLGGKPIISPVVNAAIKEHKIKTTDTAIRIAIDDPKQALKEAQAANFDEAACMRETLDAIDQRLPDVVRRANAWATGDVATLRQTATAQSNGPDCIAALSETEFARKRGIVDVPQRLKANWLGAADKALNANTVTFAQLSLEDLQRFLPELRAKGYEVIEP